MSEPDGPEKATPEAEKLALEKRLLARQLSPQGVLLAWLQGASVPVALLGAILAFFVGFGQLHQGAENQAADRFDKTLTRLASTRPDERMTGVAGLQLFLQGDSGLLQTQALQFLINGLSIETDGRVSGAILDVLRDLPRGTPSQAALDEALRTAIERNRSLTWDARDSTNQRIARKQWEALAKFNIADVDPKATSERIPARVIAALGNEQYLALLDVVHPAFKMLDPQESAPLSNLAIAIQLLFRRGATSKDFSYIYCNNCNFDSASLDEAKFEGAYLSGASFLHAKLRRASFMHANLANANFFGADLTQANLSAHPFVFRESTENSDWAQLPLLECAKLGGADLSGRTLIFFGKEFDTNWDSGVGYEIYMPRMISTQIDADTKLDSFQILNAISITDDYLDKHAMAPEVFNMTHSRNTMWESPLADRLGSSPTYRRIHADYSMDAPKYTMTVVMLGWEVQADMMKFLGKDAYVIRGFINQPNLKKMPLYSEFVDRVTSLPVPQGDAAKAAQAWSDKAEKDWATMESLPCDGDPRGHNLVYGAYLHRSTEMPVK
jgi:uncharacterized protein YjbI with pentapeptide repeats